MKKKEEKELFKEGNYADYWLGQPPRTNTLISDNVGWVPMELLLRVQRQRETKAWNRRGILDGTETLNDDSFVALMKAGGERGGGLQGGSPDLIRTRSSLIKAGRQALAISLRLMQKN